MESIQQELRKTAHYLPMRKREQAANYIDKLETALNQYSEDEIRLTHQSTIAAQAEQIEALTQAFGKGAALRYIEANKKLTEELREVIEWARTENAALRPQEIASILRVLEANAV